MLEVIVYLLDSGIDLSNLFLVLLDIEKAYAPDRNLQKFIEIIIGNRLIPYFSHERIEAEDNRILHIFRGLLRLDFLIYPLLDEYTFKRSCPELLLKMLLVVLKLSTKHFNKVLCMELYHL